MITNRSMRHVYMCRHAAASCRTRCKDGRIRRLTESCFYALQDTVTTPGTLRQRLAIVASVLAILILLPMGPEAAEPVSNLPPSMYL